MSPSLAQLRVLQQQTGTAPAPAPSPRPSPQAPADIRALRHLLRLREANTTPHAPGPVDRTLPGTEIAPGLRLIATQHRAPDIPSSIAGTFDCHADFRAGRVLFFDTETTGLAGGTGTRAFLLGAAAWSDGALHVRQLLITSIAAERAMLQTFARWLAPDTILVSYNGKCYDAPLLRTRYRLARLPDPLAGHQHIDLLHPTRRRYRDALANCRLATIERELLDITRDDDLPGSEAPAAWRTWLHGGDATNLRRVLDHNAQDVASLAQLLLNLSSNHHSWTAPSTCGHTPSEQARHVTGICRALTP